MVLIKEAWEPAFDLKEATSTLAAVIFATNEFIPAACVAALPCSVAIAALAAVTLALTKLSPLVTTAFAAVMLADRLLI